MTRLIFILLTSCFVFSSYAQCLEITGILINACNPTSDEEDNEMVTFTTGATPINVTDIDITWPNVGFQGWCTSPSSTSALNATITNGCGELLEPPGGIIPANANVIMITSTNVSSIDNTFEGLTETLYIVYQCDGGGTAQFVNSFNADPDPNVRTREIIFDISGGCTQTESVIYDRQFITNTDGERVFFDAAGNATYDNTLGCTAPVTSFSAAWNIGEVCVSNGLIDLNTLLSPSATTGGAWSGDGVTGNNFDPSALGGMNATVTYTITNSTCVTGSDSTITFPVLLEPMQGTATYQNCDSVFYNGTWYTANTDFIENYAATTPFGCDSSSQIFIEISTEITDTTFLSGCDSVMYMGTWYYSDTMINDTTTLMTEPTSSCATLFISEYLEGASNDKCLEIYNGTGAAIDLSNYTLQRYSNGTTTPTAIALSGMLADGDVYVICNPSSNATLLGISDATSGNLNFNGDDAIALFEGDATTGTMLDLIGNIGCDPGSQWTELGNGTQDNNFFRQADYTAGVTIDPANTPCDFPSFTATNWVSLDATNDFSNLGSHTANCSVTPGGASCDSIHTTSITILNSVNTFENQTTTNPANVGTVVTEFPNGAASGCDSTHTVVTTFEATCDLDTATIMSYNVLQYTSNPTVNRDADFITILSAAEPDILVLQEVQQEAGANRFRDNVMANVSADYAMATFINSNDMDNVLFYKQSEFNFVFTTAIPNSGPRDFHEFQLVHKGSCTPLYIFSIHLKAGTAPADEATRNTQANELRTITNGLPTGANFMIVGDFNGYSDTEPAYLTFTNDTGNEGHVNDPLSLAGTWNNPAYAEYHTQSPRTTSFGGGAPGGLDDRLDMILYSEAIENGASNMYHVPALYQAFGNDGQHYNVALTDAPANSAVSAAVSQALHDASDHIPVMTGFTFCISSDTTMIDTTVCNTPNYTFPDGSNTATTGVYYTILQTALGCDSIIETDLTILPVLENTIDTTVCFGESITVNGTVYNASVTGATETVNNVGAFMCDSTITINLTVLPQKTFPIDTILCAGESITVNGTVYDSNVSGAIETINNVGPFMCDSIITIDITVLATDSTFNSYTSCDPADVGVFSVTDENQFGCDSVHTDTVTLAAFSSGNESIIACDSVEVLGDWYFADTMFNDTIVGGSANGCDSITTYNITINTTTVMPQIQETACDSFEINSTWYFTSQVVNYTINGNGTTVCDSLFSVDLTINNSTTAPTQTATACDSYTWGLNGMTYTTTGMYTFNGTNPAGCPETTTLDLTINNSTTLPTEVAIECDSYTWSVDGMTYTTTGIYTFTGTNASGCPEISTLDLTINNSTTPTQVAIECDSYTWSVDGMTYTTTGIYTFTGTNAAGCSEISTLDLTIEQTPVANASNDTTINLGEQVILTVEDNATTYTWSNGDFGTTSVVSPTETTIYTVTVANGACEDEANIQIIVINEEIEVLLPTAFSPNGDGTNDVFRVVNSEDFTSITMRVYNRWGELIYDGRDGNHAWDGVYKGKMQNIAVYTYFVEVMTVRGENLQLTGNVTLLK